VLYPIPALPPFTVVLPKLDWLPFVPEPLALPAAPPAPTVTVAFPETATDVW
jgi:hypothetical protein